MAHITLSDIILVFHAEGPGIALDREFLETLCRGAISAVTPELLAKHGIQQLKAKSFGFNPIDNAEDEQARIKTVVEKGDEAMRALEASLTPPPGSTALTNGSNGAGAHPIPITRGKGKRNKK